MITPGGGSNCRRVVNVVTKRKKDLHEPLNLFKKKKRVQERREGEKVAMMRALMY